MRTRARLQRTVSAELTHKTSQVSRSVPLPPVIGKEEPPEPHPEHHGHVTALSVSPRSRSLGLASKLMRFLESRSGPGPEGHDTWFVDLFVRCTNKRAIAMYEGMGYSVYRRVVGYYTGMEGAGDSDDELDGFGE